MHLIRLIKVILGASYVECVVVMYRWLLLALLAVVATAEENSDVLELDGDSFKSGIAGKDIVLVEFYAPW